MKLAEHIKTVAFDADDTLWDNESLFREAEDTFCGILSDYGDRDFISKELFATEMKNMPILGFGAKAFTISLVETAVRVSGGKISAEMIGQILEKGKSLLMNPAWPLPGVVDMLEALRGSGKYKLVLITKGDLLDQKNKLDRSGLGKYFCHVEIVADKTMDGYSRLMDCLGVRPQEFLMVGNSFKSDISPVLDLGGYGVYIPFKVVWQHEVIEEFDHPHLFRAGSISELAGILL